MCIQYALVCIGWRRVVSLVLGRSFGRSAAAFEVGDSPGAMRCRVGSGGATVARWHRGWRCRSVDPVELVSAEKVQEGHERSRVRHG